jgi:hypothetical protein
MGGAKARVRAEHLVKLCQDFIGESDDFFIVWQRHGEVSILAAGLSVWPRRDSQDNAQSPEYA